MQTYPQVSKAKALKLADFLSNTMMGDGSLDTFTENNSERWFHYFSNDGGSISRWVVYVSSDGMTVRITGLPALPG
jgi:hypothetical protein